MTPRVVPFLWVVLAGFFTLSSAQAKNLDGRIGFGFTFPDFNSTSAVSLRWHMTPYLNTTFLLGFDTTESKNATILGVKILRNAHLEENLNFFVGVGGFMIADKGGEANTTTGLQFDGIMGAEFFFSGLPNLGFMFETGISVRTSRRVISKTIGSGFAGAGVHYYF